MANYRKTYLINETNKGFFEFRPRNMSQNEYVSILSTYISNFRYVISNLFGTQFVFNCFIQGRY